MISALFDRLALGPLRWFTSQFILLIGLEMELGFKALEWPDDPRPLARDKPKGRQWDPTVRDMVAMSSSSNEAILVGASTPSRAAWTGGVLLRYYFAGRRAFVGAKQVSVSGPDASNVGERKWFLAACMNIETEQCAWCPPQAKLRRRG